MAGNDVEVYNEGGLNNGQVNDMQDSKNKKKNMLSFMKKKNR